MLKKKKPINVLRMCVILIRTSVVDSDINFRTCSGISIEQRDKTKTAGKSR